MTFKYKAVFLDLDGTLLNSKKEISQRNINCLQKLYHSGVHVVIATGRSIYAAQTVTKSLQIPSPAIFLNGGQITESLFTKSVKVYYTPNSLRDNIYTFCRHILTYSKRFKLKNILLDTGDHFYALHPLAPEMHDFSSHYENPALIFDPFHPPQSPVIAFLFSLENEENYKDFIKAYRKFDPKNLANICTFNGWPWLGISCRNIHKGTALKKMCDDLNIAPHETIAFGDGHNDVEMLSQAGLGVAMANADSYARNAAKAHTLSNDEDGVAVFLESLFTELGAQ